MCEAGHEPAKMVAALGKRVSLYVDCQHTKGTHGPKGQPTGEATGMKGVTTGQLARAVPRGHHILADDARRLLV